MTNADVIRNMSDEELAAVISCQHDGCNEYTLDCNKCCLNWLKSESDTYGQEDWKQAVMRTFLGGRA